MAFIYYVKVTIPRSALKQAHSKPTEGTGGKRPGGVAPPAGRASGGNLTSPFTAQQEGNLRLTRKGSPVALRASVIAGLLLEAAIGAGLPPKGSHRSSTETKGWFVHNA